MKGILTWDLFKELEYSPSGMEASRVPQSTLKLDMGRMFGGFGIVNPSSYLAQSEFSMMAAE